MVEEAAASLTVNLLATGVATGTSVSAGRVRSLIRRSQVSGEIGDVATEFNKALEEAIREEDEPELEGFTDEWGEIADELADTEIAPDETSRHDHEEMEILFSDEEDAVRQIAEAYATVEGFDLDKTPQLREAMESALVRAYRRAVDKFKRSIAETELADVFQEEADIVLAERLNDLTDRLDKVEKGIADVLTQQARNEGFERLRPSLFSRMPPKPHAHWRVGFSLADVEAGIPAERDGIDGGIATDEVFGVLRDGENRIVVGRPGSGKSTLCKQVAVRWYEENVGDVLYRESGSSRFESTDDLRRAIERGDGHVLVCVEDAVRSEADSIFEVVEEYEDVGDVSFLLDARREELQGFDGPGSIDTTANLRRGRLASGMTRYSLPTLSEEDVGRVVEAFEDSTGQEVRRDPENLHENLRPDEDIGVGEMLLLSFFLPSTDDEGSPERLEAHVQARYETLHPDEDEHLRDLSGFDEELLADVGVMVNLLNASGIGIHQELVHALCHEYGYDLETHDEIEDILHELKGWFLFPDETEGGPTWTTHEVWSTLYLRELAQEHAEDQEDSRRRDRSEERTARCLDSLFRLFDDEEHLGELRKEFPGSRLFERIESEPQEEADEYLEEIFEMGVDWPVLAPLFGTTETSRYNLPKVTAGNLKCSIISARGYAYMKQGKYQRAKSEYKYKLKYCRDSNNRREEASALKNLGKIAFEQGEYDNAHVHFRNSLRVSREIDYRQGESAAFNKLGQVARAQGNYEKSQRYLQRGLKISREIGDKGRESDSLGNLGNLAGTQAQYKKAIKYYQDSLQIDKKLGNREGESVSLNNLGLTAYNREDYDKAKVYLRDGLKIAREIGYMKGESASLNNLGLVAEAQKRYNKAERYYQDSLNIDQKSGRKREEALTLKNLGALFRKKEKYSKSREHLQTGIKISREIGFQRGEAINLNNLGLVAQSQREYNEARKYHESAYNIFYQLRISQREMEARRNQIKAELNAMETQEARTHIDVAFKRLSEIDRELPEEREKLEELRDRIPDE